MTVGLEPLPEAVAEVLMALRTLSVQELTDLRYRSASLEVHSFKLYGEHRDVIYDHGPYGRPEERS